MTKNCSFPNANRNKNIKEHITHLLSDHPEKLSQFNNLVEFFGSSVYDLVISIDTYTMIQKATLTIEFQFINNDEFIIKFKL